MGVYLSKPNTKKDSEDGEATGLRWGACAMQGWRVNMEDAHIAKTDLVPDVHLFGVFDGHGGQEVARFCAKHFAAELLKNEAFQAKKYKEALEQTFLRLDALILQPDGQEALQQFKSDPDNAGSFAGCTANVCLLAGGDVFCANAGDSRAVLVGEDGQPVALSKDHKPDNETEKDRITKAGGYVREGRINDNLNLSRAIGDFEYKKNADLPPEKQIITAFPDVAEKKLEKSHKLLLMGCDGIWETMSAKEIADFLKPFAAEPKPSKGLEELLNKLVAKETADGVGCDNMSAILVVFK